MMSVLDLMKNKSLDLDIFTEDKFDFLDAPKVYDDILQNKNKSFGILLKYSKNPSLKNNNPK